MKFDQIMEKVDIEYSGSDYEYLNFNIDEEERIEYVNGTKYWLLNGKLHRTDGPAIEWANGGKEWYLNGKLHRADGPAYDFLSGNKYWYLNGKEYSEKEFNEEVKK